MKNSPFIVFSFIFFSFFSEDNFSQNWTWDGEGPGIGSDAGNTKRIYYDSLENTTYMCGWFKYFDGKEVNGVCKYDGANIYSLDTGGDNCGNIGCSGVGLRAIARYKGKLYFGFSEPSISGVPANGIATWDGTTWEPVGDGLTRFNGNHGSAMEMAVYKDELYVFGYFQKAGNDTTYYMAKWDGENWHKVEHPYYHSTNNGPHFHGAIVFEDKLYVTGNFFLNSSGSISAVDVARYDGETWETVGGGIKGGIDNGEGFVIYKNELYLYGTFRKTAGNAANKIMKLQNDQWVEVGGSLPHPGYKVHDALVFNDKLYIVGYFFEVGHGVPANNIAMWDGEKWCGLGSTFDNSIVAIGHFQDELLIAGGFGIIDGDTIHRFAKWTGGDFIDTCGLPVASSYLPEKQNHFSLHPNPAHTTLHITATLPPGGPANPALTARNLLGQLLLRRELPAAGGVVRDTVDVSGWPPGVYFITLEAGGQVVTERVVVH